LVVLVGLCGVGSGIYGLQEKRKIRQQNMQEKASVDAIHVPPVDGNKKSQ
jgi:hypothetical protein